MITRASLADVKAWAAVAARAAEDKNGEDIVILAVGSLLSVTDAFVITSATNSRQVRTIVDEIEEKVTKAGGGNPLRIEGLADATWVLMDYGDFVVHVFGTEAREFYALEGLWADAEHWEWRLALPAAAD